MSEKQKERYVTLFPFLNSKNNTVLSSVFDNKTLELIKLLRTNAPKDRKGWVILGSKSWIKGCDEAEKWCIENNKEYETVWDLPYEDVLEKFSKAEGFAYLPRGGDTCPRMVIEAKLLGCKLQINDNVQHRYEKWFMSDNVEEIENYLYAAKQLFWNSIKNVIEYKPTISGYTTTYNCMKQAYPFKQCIQSMLQFCDEVCVVDGGSDDGTWDELCLWALSEQKLVLNRIKRDWSSKYSAVFDGMQKAEARSMCTKEFCWQMDSDEIVHETDIAKISELYRLIPSDVHIMSLPVVEYWGCLDKVRCDISPWKWRLSRNLPSITHGIPKELRKFDNEGNLYAAPGTDGCDMIDSKSYERLMHVTFYNQEAENVRLAALSGNEQAKKQYEDWFNNVVNSVPSVYHYSWLDLVRKIKLYKDYWTSHWVKLNGNVYNDSAETNMMFDVPWSDVSDDMIENKAKELSNIGGWIWHRKWDGTKTPWIHLNKNQPLLMANSQE
jgi:glycosyltransferase involved in cell wall biosynthesis